MRGDPETYRAYVGNLPESVSESEVRRFFSRAGPINQVTIKTNYAFVDFDKYGDFKYAIEKYNRSEMFNKRITVEEAKGIQRDSRGGGGGGRYGSPGRYDRSYRDDSFGGRSSGRYGPSSHKTPRKLSYRVLVMNLPMECDWSDLKDHMKQAGDVNYTSTHDPVSTVGIVEFDRSRDIKKAVQQFDKTEFMGHVIRVLDPKSFCDESSKSGGVIRNGSRSNKSQDEFSIECVDEYVKSRSRERSYSPEKRAGSPRRDGSQSRSRSRSTGSPASKNGTNVAKRAASAESHSDQNIGTTPTKMAKYTSNSGSATPVRED